MTAGPKIVENPGTNRPRFWIAPSHYGSICSHCGECAFRGVQLLNLHQLISDVRRVDT